MKKRTEKPLPLKKRLISSNLAIIIIPTIILIVLMTTLFLYITISNTIRIAQRSNEEILKNVDNSLDSLVLLSNYPAIDPGVLDTLKKDYKSYGSSSQWEQIEDISKMEEGLYRHIYSMNHTICSVYLVPANSTYVYNEMLGNVDYQYDYKNADWYRQIIKASGHVVVIGKHVDEMNTLKKSSVTIGRSIIDPINNTLLGVVAINVDEPQIANLWKSINVTPHSFTVVSDESNRIIYQKNSVTSGADVEGVVRKLRSNGNYPRVSLTWTDQELFLAVCSDPGTYRWRTVSVVPVNELIASAVVVLLPILVAIMAMVAILIVTSTKIANRITRPIDRLKNTIQEIEQGDLTAKAAEGTDEIGLLAKSFNNMTARIHGLIEQIHAEENKKRNAELMALQAQINPHFLYNTLNSIKVMAQIQGATGIANTLESLVSFLHFCTKSSDELIPLAEEAKIAQDYVDIMNIRYLNRITYRCRIPSDLRANLTIRFLLQPMIENAIVHGFPQSHSKNIINVSARQENKLLVIRVADNGVGIKSELCQAILDGTLETKKNRTNSIGLFNVNQRIKMTFGNEYGIRLESKVGYYTVVETRLPLLTDQEGAAKHA